MTFIKSTPDMIILLISQKTNKQDGQPGYQLRTHSNAIDKPNKVYLYISSRESRNIDVRLSLGHTKQLVQFIVCQRAPSTIFGLFRDRVTFVSTSLLRVLPSGILRCFFGFGFDSSQLFLD